MKPWLAILLLATTACTTTRAPTPPENPDKALPVLQCDGRSAHLAVREEHATLYLPGLAISLPKTPAASGSRYAANGYVLHEKGGEARLQTPAETWLHCRITQDYDAWAAAWLQGVDFRAWGHEPGWLLEISEDQALTLNWAYGKKSLTMPVPTTQRDGDLFVLAGRTDKHQLLVEIMPGPCRDTGRGDVHGYGVRIQLDDKTLLGCGRGLMPLD
jgi:uncharacterized membrane protein